MRPASLALVLLLGSCSGSASTPAPDASAPAPDASAPAPDASAPLAAASTTTSAGLPGSRAPRRARIDGRAFPDKVIALTWDDGPDAKTIELARYLKSRHVSATFFVVGSWVDGISEAPGEGHGVFETGYERLPVLGQLVGLGHRLGNHTRHHVVLRDAVGAPSVTHEIVEAQRYLDPFLENELRLFRAPGGGWGTFAESVFANDASLARIVGPVAWDVDRKDWDESLSCHATHDASECERAAPGGALRTKPSVMAARYVSTIAHQGHGIVLLHDRVGHVGSSYALDVARAMIPELEAHGFVFAAPVLRFSPLVVRLDGRHWQPASWRLADVDGDGRADVCGRDDGGVSCALSVRSASGADDALPRTVFRAPERSGAGTTAHVRAIDAVDGAGDGRGIGPTGAHRWTHADVDGDGRSDVCAQRPGGLVCARSTGKGFGKLEPWTSELTEGPLHFGDLNGDGRQDVCGHTPEGVVCALSTGRAFTKATVWLTPDLPDAQLGDINGDHRADLCGQVADGLACALAP